MQSRPNPEGRVISFDSKTSKFEQVYKMLIISILFLYSCLNWVKSIVMLPAISILVTFFVRSAHAIKMTYLFK